MNTHQIVRYTVMAVGAVILLCLAIALLRTLARCCDSRARDKRRRRRPCRDTPVAVVARTDCPHQHLPPYTIAASAHGSPYPFYGATPAHQQPTPSYPHHAHHPHHAPPPSYRPAATPVQDYTAATAPPPPPPYFEAAPSEGYTKQAAYNPGYQHA